MGNKWNILRAQNKKKKKSQKYKKTFKMITLVPDATSPTPPEPSMLPRGRLRLTPTTTEDTVSDTGPTEDTEDTASDTAVATSTVRFCLDVLDLDATMLPTFCPWIGPRRI